MSTRNIVSGFEVRNNSTKTIRILGAKIQPGATVDLFRAIVGLSESRVIDEMSGPAGHLYLLVQRGMATIVRNNLTTFENEPSSSESLLDDANIVANLSALSAKNISEMFTGSRVFVTSLDCEFKLDLASTITIDSITSVATSSGSGRFLRVMGPSAKWAAQTTWYVSNATGNDENSGAVGFPVKTMAELSRRLYATTISTYTINVLDDVPSSDQFDFNPHVLAGSAASGQVLLNVVGTQLTPLATGAVVIGGTIGTTPATNTPATLQDASISWASYVGKLVKMTSGALVDYVAVVVKDLGSNTARLSPWFKPGTNPSLSGTFAGVGVAPANGDTFSVLALTSMAGTIRHGPSKRVHPTYANFIFPTNAASNIEGVRTFFHVCEFPMSLSGGGLFRHNAPTRISASSFKPPASPSNALAFYDQRIRFTACGMIGVDVFSITLARMEFDGTLMQEGSVRVGRLNPGNTTFDSSPSWTLLGIFAGNFGLGIMDATSVGVQVVRGSVATIDGPLWGANNLVGVKVEEGGEMYVRSTITPTITGTTEVQLEGAATAMPPLEASAGLSLPALSALTTWAHWTGAPFSRNVLNYGKGSRIASVAAPGA